MNNTDYLSYDLGEVKILHHQCRLSDITNTSLQYSLDTFDCQLLEDEARKNNLSGDADNSFVEGSRVWVTWGTGELKATIKRFNRNDRPVVKWDGVSTQTTVDMVDILRFIDKEDLDEKTTASSKQPASHKRLVPIAVDLEGPEDVPEEEEEEYEPESHTPHEEPADNIVEEDSKQHSFDEDSIANYDHEGADIDSPIPKAADVPLSKEDTAEKKHIQSDDDTDEISDGKNATSLSPQMISLSPQMIMVKELQQQLDNFTQSIDEAKRLIVAWNKRKAEIKQEMVDEGVLW